jgi:hypothetical protein
LILVSLFPLRRTLNGIVTDVTSRPIEMVCCARVMIAIEDLNLRVEGELCALIKECGS